MNRAGTAKLCSVLGSVLPIEKVKDLPHRDELTNASEVDRTGSLREGFSIQRRGTRASIFDFSHG
jgi:hypothetical protein